MISSARTELLVRACWMASVPATQTSSMLSSAKCACGLVIGTLRAPRAISFPWMSKIAALTTDVPASNPMMYSAMVLLCGEVVSGEFRAATAVRQVCRASVPSAIDMTDRVYPI
jgi:hypothetical protein